LTKEDLGRIRIESSFSEGNHVTRINANHDRRRSAWPIALGVGLIALGCQHNPDAPPRSPTKDYPLPPPQTSDGQVLGADNRPPEDRLQEGVSTDGPAPGWSVGEEGLKYDPERPARGTTPPHAPHDAAPATKAD
jgi:hypothetical protein